MQQKIKIILIYMLAFCVFLSVPVYFMGISSSVARILTGPLGIKVNPDLAGGEVPGEYPQHVSQQVGQHQRHPQPGEDDPHIFHGPHSNDGRLQTLCGRPSQAIGSNDLAAPGPGGDRLRG